MECAMKWEPQYEVGIEFVDQDHRQLFQLIQFLDKSKDDDDTHGTLSSILEVLKDYALHHFAKEEAMMQQAGYAHFETHKKEHETLLQDIQKIADTYKRNPTAFTPHEIRQFLHGWLVEHILGYDIAIQQCQQNQAALQHSQSIGFLDTLKIQPAHKIDWKKVRVLILDENKHFRIVLQTVLRTVGIMQIREASLQQEHTEIWHTDIVMVNADLTTDMQAIKALIKRQPQAKYILMCSDNIDHLIDDAIDAGAHAVMPKPITAKNVTRICTQLLRGSMEKH
jgi:hemerythrin-like metal-binding protein